MSNNSLEEFLSAEAACQMANSDAESPFISGAGVDPSKVKCTLTAYGVLEAKVKILTAELECARGDLRQAMQIVERDQKDAERYRWLRNNQLDALEIMEKFVGEQMEYCTEEELDSSIDAAIVEDSHS